MFFRRVPDGGGYAIMAGVEQLIDYFKTCISPRRISPTSAAAAASRNPFSITCANLNSRAMYGPCRRVRRFPLYEPLVTVAGPMIQAQFVETMVLLTINHQTLIATKASCITAARRGAPCSNSAPAARRATTARSTARAPLISAAVGDGVRAGRIGITRSPRAARWRIPRVQMFDSEYEAFKAYADIYPDNRVFLVDTYNVLKSGVPNGSV